MEEQEDGALALSEIRSEGLDRKAERRLKGLVEGDEFPLELLHLLSGLRLRALLQER